MRNPDRETIFRFKRFAVANDRSAMKVGTDSVTLGAWVTVDSVRSALDVGSGCGVLALMLAQRGVERIIGIEIDGEAAMESRMNVAASPWPERVEIIHADATEWSAWEEKKREKRETPTSFDLIISNPPYFSSELLSPEESRATARHEGSLSFATLMKLADRHLAPGGRLAIVAPTDRENDIEWEATLQRLSIVRKCGLSTSPRKAPKRVMYEFAKGDLPREEDTLLIVNSDAYRQLTNDFYLDR